jgi:hypothetical protein
VFFTDSPNIHKPGKKVINVVTHAQWPAVLAKSQAKNDFKRGIDREQQKLSGLDRLSKREQTEYLREQQHLKQKTQNSGA